MIWSCGDVVTCKSFVEYAAGCVGNFYGEFDVGLEIETVGIVRENVWVR